MSIRATNGLGAGKALLAAVFFCCMLLQPGAAQAQDNADSTIIWPYFSFPPYVIIGEDGKLSGINMEIRRLLWGGLPEYEHKTMEAPFARSYMMAREGTRMCFTGLLKTDDREQYLKYSIPILASGPNVLVTRKGILDRYKKEGRVSLAEVLSDRELTFGLINEFSHGKTLDPLIQPYLHDEHVLVIKDMKTLTKQFDLLRAGRIDYFIFHDIRVAYYAGEHGKYMEFIPISEEEEPFLTYVACTAGEWGEKVVARVNEVLARAIPTEEYLELPMNWVEPSLRPRVRRRFEEILVPAARDYAP